MITIKGKSVFGGVSIGKIMFYKRNEKVIKRTHVDDVDAEWKRFCDAKDTAVSQLKELYDKAIEDVGEANAMIFEIHQMMLEDLVSHIAHSRLFHPHPGQKFCVLMGFPADIGHDLLPLIHGHAANHLLRFLRCGDCIIHILKHAVGCAAVLF